MGNLIDWLYNSGVRPSKAKFTLNGEVAMVRAEKWKNCCPYEQAKIFVKEPEDFRMAFSLHFKVENMKTQVGSGKY